MVSNRRPGQLGPVSEGPRGQPAVPGDSRLGPSACGVDQQSRATRALVGGTAVSTRPPWHLGPMPEDLRGRPAVPGDSGLIPRAHGFDQMSRVTRAWV